jgi:alkyl sulfatase BDS1-like metallo-beta-lactamase superfamily hydrolase
MNHVVFADPDNQAARNLEADALEQLGYQAESGPWRNFYLTGAKELRDGVMQLPTPSAASPDSVRAMTLDTFLDYLGIRLDGPKAAGKKITVNISLTDTRETAVLFLANGSLSHSPDRQDPDADATLTMARSALDDIILGTATVPDLVDAGHVELDGDADKLHELLDLLDTFEFWFNIVTP